MESERNDSVHGLSRRGFSANTKQGSNIGSANPRFQRKKTRREIIEMQQEHLGDHLDEYGRSKRYVRNQEFSDLQDHKDKNKGICGFKGDTEKKKDPFEDPEADIELEAMNEELYDNLKVR